MPVETPDAARLVMRLAAHLRRRGKKQPSDLLLRYVSQNHKRPPALFPSFIAVYKAEAEEWVALLDLLRAVEDGGDVETAVHEARRAHDAAEDARETMLSLGI